MDKVKFLKHTAIKLDNATLSKRIDLCNAVKKFIPILKNSAITNSITGNFTNIYFCYSTASHKMMTMGEVYPTTSQVISIDEAIKKLTPQNPKW
jgi:hypothetical protein